MIHLTFSPFSASLVFLVVLFTVRIPSMRSAAIVVGFEVTLNNERLCLEFVYTQHKCSNSKWNGKKKITVEIFFQKDF